MFPSRMSAPVTFGLRGNDQIEVVCLSMFTTIVVVARQTGSSLIQSVGDKVKDDGGNEN